MSKLNFITVSPEITGSIIEAEDGYLLSVFHHPTGAVLNGYEDTVERALSWMQGARFYFADAEGRA